MSKEDSRLPQIVLKPRRAQPFFNRHPWVFTGAIARVDGDPEPGDQVDLRTHDGKFVGRGLFNPNSNIRVRMYAWDEATALDETFWSQRIDEALTVRSALFPDAGAASACRLIYSEADQLSGLIVDRYGDWLIVQFTSLALASFRDSIVRLLQAKLQPAGIWLRTEKGVGAAEGLDVDDGLIAGKEPPRPLFVEDNKVQYGVDVVEGQKTGFYLDQRDNRVAVAGYVRNHDILDVFCYSGGFGLAAVLLGEAKSVVGIDVSASAIQLAEGNATLNSVADRMRFEAADAFDRMEELNRAGETFDTVILDPPKMIRHRSGLEKAMRGYFSLNRMAVDLLVPGGLLVTCSCSGLVGRNDFENMLSTVALRSERAIQILEARGQAPDHPISVQCPETRYLKCYICRVG